MSTGQGDIVTFGSFPVLETSGGGGPTPGTGSIIADFEGDDAAFDYTEDQSSYSIQSTTVHSGSQALSLVAGDSGFDTTVSTGTGATTLPRYPEAGETFEFYIHTDGNVGHFGDVLFFVQPDTVGVSEPPDCISIRYDDSQMKLYEWSAGSIANQATIYTGTRTVDEWHRVELDPAPDGSTISASLEDSSGTQLGSVATITPTNSYITAGGGFGWRPAGNQTDTVTLDDVQLVNQSRVIDDFADGDLAEYSGDLAQFSVVPGFYGDGTNAVEGVTDGGAYIIEASLASGLPYTPQPGDTFRTRIRTDAANAQGPRVGWATQGAQLGSNRYQVFVDVAGGALYIDKRTGGTTGTWNTLDSVSGPINDNTAYDLEIQWGDDGTIVAGLYLVGDSNPAVQTSGVIDADYSSGGIAMIANGGGSPATMHFGEWRTTTKTPATGGSLPGGGGGGGGGGGAVGEPVTQTVTRSSTGVDGGAIAGPDTTNAVRASQAGGPQAAINQADGGSGVAIIDGSYSSSSSLVMRSGVDVVGENGVWDYNGGGDAVEFQNVQNVHLHNLRIVHQVGNFARCVGSADPGEIKNVTVTQCDLVNGGNGFSFRWKSTQPDCDGLTLEYNYVTNSDRHGFFIGSDDGVPAGPDGEKYALRNIRIANNHTEDLGRWMHITFAGKVQALTTGYIAGNYCDSSMQTSVGYGGDTKHDGWTNHGITFEEEVVDTVIEYNRVDKTQKSGIGCTGGANNNVFRNNLVIGGPDATSIMLRLNGLLPHDNDPHNNTFENNRFEEGRKWAVKNDYDDPSGGDNRIVDNTFVTQHNIKNFPGRDIFDGNEFI